MKFFLKGTLILFLCTSVKVFAQNSAVKIEKGVSQSLAEERKKILSDLHYQLHFNIPPERSDSITGEEFLSFHLKNKKNSLQLDYKNYRNRILFFSVNGKNCPVDFREEHLVIQSKYLFTGENKIEIRFIANDLSLNRNSDFLYTLLVPDRARTLFPCFDQPNLKAKYQLTLSVPKDWKVLGNASIHHVDSNNNKRNFYFNESDLFSTYLFSFVAGKFKIAEKQVDHGFMHFYYRETDTNKIKLSVDTIFGLHKLALHFLENYTQIKFPFQKLDFAGVPDFQYGGMEHVGAIDYRASTLFLDSGATKDQENARSNLIAHETSHMWFGDLVTMQWFNDVWMKEVFANFMADKITQGNQSSNNYEIKFLLTHFPRAYAIDRTEGANPIRQKLFNLQEAGNLYGPIIYDKAPVMMRQLERLMGANAFRDGLREYLKKYSFQNATWDDLIEILGKRTPANLHAWNKVWVNTPGRPVFTYSLQENNGFISKLIIAQKGERSKNYLLPQFFEIALIYADHIEELTVNMNQQQVELKEAEKKKMPLYILFNSSGQGYGLFPVDKKMQNIVALNNPVMRGSAYINLYENMLSGNFVKPNELLNAYLKLITEEKEELNVSLIAGHIADIYWRLITPSQRIANATTVENILWSAMQKETAIGKKKIFFRTFQNIALSKNALDTLYQIWKNRTPPQGVKLAEDEYTSLALDLAVKEYPDENILKEEIHHITNPDRKKRLQFIMPAVSRNEKERDAFFASLKNLDVRKKESWVADALGYLHHPLRTSTSIKYLKESLNMLQEIQLTNDIFFPATWLNKSFNSYQTKEAADIVRDFLKAHPHYNAQLRMKILQAADPLFRAEILVRQ